MNPAWNSLHGSNCSTSAAYNSIDPMMDSFVESTFSALAEKDMQIAWQSMLQQEQKRQQLCYQRQHTIPFYSPNLASFYPCNQQVLPPVSYAPNYGFSNLSESQMVHQYGSNSSELVTPESHLKHLSAEKLQLYSKAPLEELTIPSNTVHCSLSPSGISEEAIHLMASAASEHYGSTSCEESDSNSSCDAYPALESAKETGRDDHIDLSEYDKSSDTTENGSRKRKQYWRQVWYKERNKEYSRNWRCKKKQEEESLRSEISMLRAYKELMEETLEMHIHDPNQSGLPFTHVSSSFLRMLNVNSASLLGKDLMSFVLEKDQSKIRDAFEAIQSKNDTIEVSYQLKNPASDTYHQYRSSLRLCSRGVMMITVRVH